MATDDVVGGAETTDDSYPQGVNMKIPSGKTLSMQLPGADAGLNTTRRDGPVHPRSAAHCGDRMSSMVPGAAIGKTTSHEN